MRVPAYLYALLTWTTRERADLIDARVAASLRRFLPRVAGRFGAELIDSGFASDHVHVLLLLPTRIDIPRLVQAIKGASSRVANRDGIAVTKLRWANGYDLRSVSPSSLPAVSRYLARQGEHHPAQGIRDRERGVE